MVTAVNSRMVRVRAAMWLSTTGGEEEMNGRSWRSPTPNPSKPSSSARTALSTTSRNRSVVLRSAGDRVGQVGDQGDQQELHAGTVAFGGAGWITGLAAEWARVYGGKTGTGR